MIYYKALSYLTLHTVYFWSTASNRKKVFYLIVNVLTYLLIYLFTYLL